MASPVLCCFQDTTWNWAPNMSPGIYSSEAEDTGLSREVPKPDFFNVNQLLL
jgi:hypothetical protein